MSKRRMVSRTPICKIMEAITPEPQMLWSGSHEAYVNRVLYWFGDQTKVIDYSKSKSIDIPMVRLADGILLAYNFYEYLLYVPRSVWRKVSSRVKSKLSYDTCRVRHPSFRWEAGQGEIIICGGGNMVRELISEDVLRAESYRQWEQFIDSNLQRWMGLENKW
jgi:hypothetical protein